MLEKFTDEEITNALVDMEPKENNHMRQEFIEGLRNGRPNNYINFRIFMKNLAISEEEISTKKITEVLQMLGLNGIIQMREQIFNGVTQKEHGSYSALRKFFNKLDN